MNSTQYKRCLDKLNRYAKKLDLDIIYGDTFAYHPITGSIEVNKSQQNKCIFLIYYLHELGHAIQNDSYFHKLKYKTLNIKRSIILEQEYTAWVNGYHIANELNILNTLIKEYLKEWVSAWQDYAIWIHKADVKSLDKLFAGYISEGRPPLG